MISPVAGFKIALRSMKFILGIKKPFVVLFNSRIELPFGVKALLEIPTLWAEPSNAGMSSPNDKTLISAPFANDFMMVGFLKSWSLLVVSGFFNGMSFVEVCFQVRLSINDTPVFDQSFFSAVIHQNRFDGSMNDQKPTFKA